MKWVLILTLYYSGGGMAIESIEFESLSACEFAAKRWLEDNGLDQPTVRESAICAPLDLPGLNHE